MAQRILGYVCLASGAIGLVLPFIPGIPLLILGFKLLGRTDAGGARDAK